MSSCVGLIIVSKVLQNKLISTAFEKERFMRGHFWAGCRFLATSRVGKKSACKNDWPISWSWYQKQTFSKEHWKGQNIVPMNNNQFWKFFFGSFFSVSCWWWARDVPKLVLRDCTRPYVMYWQSFPIQCFVFSSVLFSTIFTVFNYFLCHAVFYCPFLFLMYSTN